MLVKGQKGNLLKVSSKLQSYYDTQCSTPTMAMKNDDVSIDRRDFMISGMLGGLGLLWGSKPSRAEGPSAAVLQQISKCDPAVSHMIDPRTNKEVFLIGTAHISNISALLVQDTVRAVRPDVVMVELDASRVAKPKYASASSQEIGPPSSPSNSDQVTTEVLSSGVPASAPAPSPAAAYSSERPSIKERIINSGAKVIGKQLSGMYQQLDKMGFQSGEEFVVAIKEGQAVGASILLGDRNVQVTLRRLTEALGKTDLKKLSSFEIPEEDKFLSEISMDNSDSIRNTVELLKRREAIRPIMAALKDAAPDVYNAMIAERDEYMANMLRYCNGKRIVAVVGMAHMDGIERNLGYELINTCYQ